MAKDSWNVFQVPINTSTVFSSWVLCATIYLILQTTSCAGPNMYDIYPMFRTYTFIYRKVETIVGFCHCYNRLFNLYPRRAFASLSASRQVPNSDDFLDILQVWLCQRQWKSRGDLWNWQLSCVMSYYQSYQMQNQHIYLGLISSSRREGEFSDNVSIFTGFRLIQDLKISCTSRCDAVVLREPAHACEREILWPALRRAELSMY